MKKEWSVFYKEEVVGKYIPDLIVDDTILLELKAVATLRPEYEWQWVNYLKATGIKVGLLLNFGQSGEIRRKILTNKTV